MFVRKQLAYLSALSDSDPWLILSVQSNQFVQSKMQFVQSKMRNCAVQKHKVEDIIVQLNQLTYWIKPLIEVRQYNIVMFFILKIKLVNVS